MSCITKVRAREVFDSRGRPTVEVDVVCSDGLYGRAIAPSGASTGRHEARELRDADPQRFGGLGVQKAVAHVNERIADALVGLPASEQRLIDTCLCDLDGTAAKSRLGANAILATSLAVSRAAAASAEIPYENWLLHLWQQYDCSASDPRQSIPHLRLPLLMVNMISGGLHAGGNLDFQDYLLIPVGATCYRESFEWIVTVYHELGRQLSSAGMEGHLVGDEGGYGPRLPSNEAALDFLLRSIDAAGLNPGVDLMIGLDVASTHFFDSGYYRLRSENRVLDSEQMIDELERLVDNYPVISIEDGLAEDDWTGWKQLTERLGHRVQLIGDDLFVTNLQRLQRGISEQTANSILIKLNQIGTLSETLETLHLAIVSEYLPVISARSGETEDTTIAELVVATGAGQLKVGSVARSERLAKYNQLLRIEERLGIEAEFTANSVLGRFRGGPADS